MRVRMYRDDTNRVVDEIENSEVMWLGISQGVLGHDQINPEEVNVRSEIARLTRLYDRAVKTNTNNNPEMYTAGVGADVTQAGLTAGPLPSQSPVLVSIPDPTPVAPATDTPAAAPAPDPDESPVTTAKPTPTPKQKSDDVSKDSKKPTSRERGPSPLGSPDGHAQGSSNEAPETHDGSSSQP